jgi:hypothetical protein
MTDNTNKMLRAIINGQSIMKSELITEIRKVDKKVDSLKEETGQGFKNVNERIDKLGKSLAYLEDDAPTRDEFDGLEVRVKKVERKVASV